MAWDSSKSKNTAFEFHNQLPESQQSSTYNLPLNETDSQQKGRRRDRLKGSGDEQKYELLQYQSQFSNSLPPTTTSLKTRKKSYKLVLSWGWVWETLHILIAALCFGAMVILLIILHNQPLPQWRSGITVNSVLAVLASLMKGALGFSIAECLCQLKWSWFRQERKLVDLVILDEASRGPWGAGRLMLTLRRWPLAYLGSLATLLIIVLVPSVQQSVDIYTRQIPRSGQNATIPICNTTDFSVVGVGPGPGLNRVDLPTVGAIYNGLLQTYSESPINPDCASGNCTFPTYQSLGIVANCTDMTSELIYFNRSSPTLNDDGSLTYPPGYNQSITASDCNNAPLSCAASWPRYNLELQPYSILNSTVNISDVLNDAPTQAPPFFVWQGILGPGQVLADMKPTPIISVQCTLHFAIYTYNASMTGGDLTETVIATSTANSHFADDPPDQAFFGGSSNFTIPADPCYINGQRVPPAQHPDQCSYQVQSLAGLAFANTLAPMLTGNGTRSVGNRAQWSSDPLQGVSGFLDEDSYNDPLVGSFQYVDNAFQSLATTLTQHARGSTSVCGNASSLGVQWDEQVYLHVRWAWLVPSALVLIMSLVFFVVVAIRDRGEELWKTSPLAELVLKMRMGGMEVAPERVLGVDGEGGGGGGGHGRFDPRMAEKAADDLFVTFGPVKQE